MNRTTDRMAVPRAAICRGIALALLAQGVLAAAPTEREPGLDSVLVEGNRTTLEQLRQEMIRIEDRFYERYNELNIRHDFDVHCVVEAPIGTRFKSRYCRAVFVSNALQEEGREDTLYHQRIHTTPGGETVVIGGPPPPAIQAIEMRRPEFRDNLRDVVRQNPELLRLLRERYALAERYEAVRRAKSGAKPGRADVQPSTGDITALPGRQ